MVKEKNKMKNENILVKLTVARKALKEWDSIPISTIYKAMDQKPPLIPHVVTSNGKRATKLVTVNDLRKYYESLKR